MIVIHYRVNLLNVLLCTCYFTSFITNHICNFPFRPEQRFADLVSFSREDSEDSEGSMPKSILRRDNLTSDGTPPKVRLHCFVPYFCHCIITDLL